MRAYPRNESSAPVVPRIAANRFDFIVMDEKRKPRLPVQYPSHRSLPKLPLIVR
jgi:hypothetical protein